MKWTKRNLLTVVVAACITMLFTVWLWGFTHYERQLNQTEEPETPQAEQTEEGEQMGEESSDNRYLPSSGVPLKESKPAPKEPEPIPEVSPEEFEPIPEETEEKGVPAEEDVPEWEPGWKEPEWPEWPEWSERQTTPRRSVTGTVGSVPRWADR